MMPKEIINLIKGAIKDGLPGKEAQIKMVSASRLKDIITISENDSTKRSGVLILLYPKNNELYSVLIKRPEYDGVHSGQIALPGGKHEPQDINMSQTALRETFEEIGVTQQDIELVGSLTKLFIPPSNFTVYPFIGYSDNTPVFNTDPFEVAGIVEYKIKTLLDDSIIKNIDISIRNNYSINARYFDIEGNVVWGATAMILSEFKELLKLFSNTFLISNN